MNLDTDKEQHGERFLAILRNRGENEGSGKTKIKVHLKIKEHLFLPFTSHFLFMWLEELQIFEFSILFFSLSFSFLSPQG
jgi:hypothetical protein